MRTLILLKVQELVSNLQTFEFGFCQSNLLHSKTKKGKDVALSITKIDNLDSDEDDFDPQQMTLFIKIFQKFYKKQKPKTNVFQNKKGNDKNKFESKKDGEKKNEKNHVQGV